MSEGYTVTINGDASGVSYPTSTSWRADVALEMGANYLYVVAVSANGRESNALLVIVQHNGVGDVNGDEEVDDYDLSLLVHAWGSDETSVDFNGDDIVDDYDFSLFVSRWSERA